MVAFNFLVTMSLAIASAVAHPLNEQLVGRDVYSTSTATSSYRHMSEQFRSLRTQIGAGGLSYSEARSRMESISQSTRQSLQTIGGCGQVCFGNGQVQSITSSASESYREMASLVQTINSHYGPQASVVAARESTTSQSQHPQHTCMISQISSLTTLSYPTTALVGLDTQFASNLRQFQQSGVSVNQVIPNFNTFLPAFNQVGFRSTASFASSSSSHHSGSVTTF
ncbi:hypothetical protein PGT21_023796 [Puccinia graminis f. sp. tritici]|uniref:Uncharacterized protein n=1 Tax=Puccinia graminis f. sp. tritici TaxID=56615 RepID=A0A5B0LZS6_PUCGR|nr:hypothetical protein PGT21_023796 [Puccinia graminis f. sp. tritici]KAA1075439.1 hypothetical protein PGTUg99_005769 [Puccinia graminis f. sp. tritici]